MFGAYDLYTCVIIENKLQFLSRNQEQLEFILLGYVRNQDMLNKVGKEYIKKAIDYIQNNAIQVFPYDVIDQKQNPRISIICSGSEDQKYIGDYGLQQMAPSKYQTKQTPMIIEEFTAVKVNSDSLTVPPELKLNEKLWTGLVITNGTYSGILESVGPDTLNLKTPIPEHTAPTNWRAQMSGSNKLYNVGASTDNILIQIALTTYGDPSVHRLLGVVLRSILKSERLQFDTIGIQNVSVSYNPMQCVDQGNFEFMTTYEIRAQATDAWIDSEVQTPDPSSKLVIKMEADQYGSNRPETLIKL